MELIAANQMTTLEQSKRLYELGVQQKSLFVWRKYSLAPEARLYYDPERMMATLSGTLEYEYAAFSTAELGELMKFDTPVYDNWHTENNKKFTENKKQAWYLTIPNEDGDREDPDRHIWIHADSEVDARAQALIYKLEHNL